ncbi:hypothetical protein, partial [Bifidobacterium asteroides]|uniref:hypothetical protein n=1 Tax=Bifidobacterium asteroides TaxID=1684 RepID=UPI0005296676
RHPACSRPDAAQTNQSAGRPDRIILIILIGSRIQTARSIDRPQRTPTTIRVRFTTADSPTRAAHTWA